jgi:uncharacterized protein (DUF58 family)
VTARPPLLPPGFVARLHGFDLVSRHAAGILPGGLHLAGRAGAGTLFRDHRPYAPGDDPRSIDWNVMARHDILITKQFESEEAVRAVLLLDASGSMAEGDRERLAAAARALAVAGTVALGRGDAVDLLVLPGGRRRTFSGRGSLPGLLGALEAVEAGGRTDLASGFRTGLAGIRGRALAVLASDFLDPRGACAGVDFLLHRGWEVRALQPVAPGDLEPPPAGRVLLVDAETGEERAVEVTAALRERLREGAHRRLRAVKEALRSRGVPWVRLPTGEGSEGALLAALRLGGVLG